jgi:hypothetical protein
MVRGIELVGHESLRAYDIAVATANAVARIRVADPVAAARVTRRRISIRPC